MKKEPIWEPWHANNVRGPYPEGRGWRCAICGTRYPESYQDDRCPRDEGVLMRTMLSFDLPTHEGLRYAEGSPLNTLPCQTPSCGHLAIQHYERHAPAMFNDLPCGVAGCGCDNFDTDPPA